METDTDEEDNSTTQNFVSVSSRQACADCVKTKEDMGGVSWRSSYDEIIVREE